MRASSRQQWERAGLLWLYSAVFAMTFGPLNIKVLEIVCNEMDVDDCYNSEDASAETATRLSYLAALQGGAIGQISDRYGRRFGLALPALGYLLDCAVMASVTKMSLLYILHGLTGIFGSLFTFLGVSYASMSDVAGQRERGNAFGGAEAAFFLGQVCGPYLASAIGNDMSLSAQFTLAGSLTGVVFLLVFVVMRGERAAKACESPVSLPGEKSSWRNITVFHSRRTMVLSCVFALHMAAVEGYINVILVYLEHRFHFGDVIDSLYLGTSGLVCAIVVGIILRFVLSKRFSEAALSIVGVFVSAGFFVAISVAPTRATAFACLIALGIGALGAPLLRTRLSREFGVGEQGRALAEFEAVHIIVACAAPLAFNHLYNIFVRHGHGGRIFWVAAGCSSAAGLLLVAMQIAGARASSSRGDYIPIAATEYAAEAVEFRESADFTKAKDATVQ